MWQGYFKAIYQTLFLPFILYFFAFIAYTGYFASHEDNDLSMHFILEIVCLVVCGKTYIRFLLLELIQMRNKGLRYFTDAWNIMDFCSLVINAFYIGGEVTNEISHHNLQIIGSVAVFIMWIKLFYWMRLFKPFSAFIRMITEIMKDIQVFFVMLIIAIGAFANIIFILNINRGDHSCTHDPECGPIYDSVIGFAPIDALIHAYLTGLGDFNKDNYS
jgi:hypothetical protein